MFNISTFSKFLPLLLFLVIGACSSDTEEPSAKAKKTESPAYTPTGNERFQRIDPASSGIDFENRITEDHQLNIITNSYMYNGGGVAVLDFNNDNLQDLYFISTQEDNKLYLNKGNLQFEDVTQSAGVAASGGFKTGVSAVDINTDGWMDLYVCRTGIINNAQRQNLLFINQGDGTFKEDAASYGLNIPTASNHANFFDYDLYGDLHKYLLNHPTDFTSVNNMILEEVDGKRVRVTRPKDEFESDRLYRNEGNNTFTNVSEQAGIVNRAFGLSVTTSDFNDDGYPDLFIGNDYIEPDIVYINQKDGTFEDQTDRYLNHMSNHTMGVDIADFNNDQRDDIIALDMIAEDNRRQKLLMTTMVLQRYNRLVEFGYGQQQMRNVLQLNTGSDKFSEIGTFSGISNTDWSWSALFADLDNDGWKDLYITNGYRRDVSNLDYLTYTVDSLNQTGGITKERFPEFTDFLDLIPSERLQNYAYRNKGDLSFEKVSNEWGFLDPSFSNGAAYADLDGDGDLEIITNNIADPAFIYENRTNEQTNNHYIAVDLEGPDSNPTAVGARVTLRSGELTQAQTLTPTRGFFSSVQTVLHFGLGQSEGVELLEVRWPDGKTHLLENIPGDQLLTINYAEANGQKMPEVPQSSERLFAEIKGPDFRHRENAFEDFDRERLLPHRLSQIGPFIAEGDVDGNGQNDFFIGNAGGQMGALYLQSNGSFSKKSGPWETDSKYEDTGCLFFDADGDSDLDLYVVSGGNANPANSDLYQDRLYLNDGSGNFSASANVLPRITASGSCVQAHDFDQDGDQDLFVGGRVVPGNYPMTPQSFVLQNDGGTFSDVTDQVAPDFRQAGMVTDIRFGDLDGDGVSEMIVAGEWMPIYVFRWADGKYNREQLPGTSNTKGWWNCLALNDVDGDGDLDLAAGNLGLNSRIKATAGEPLRIYTTDFDNNGTNDPIITYVNDGVEYPLARKEALIKQISLLKKDYLYFEPYSTASVQEVFDPVKLQNAQKLEANNMETSLFLNDGGSFKSTTLPVFSQIAPVNQILMDDLNGDGHTDLLLVGNNFNADVESGPYDANPGIVLLGDGTGNFRHLPTQNTGLKLHGEVRDVSLLRTSGGKAVLVVANNDDTLELYQLN
ncbi:MAG: VCBS repeat-containing protein [Bacteroidetes bacterium]|nr:VCBS repeat-containing protein [Bacteroidota bacterium]